MVSVEYVCKACGHVLSSDDRGKKRPCTYCVDGVMKRQAPPGSYRSILDRIGKAAREGNQEDVLAECLRLKFKLWSDTPKPLKKVVRVSGR